MTVNRKGGLLPASPAERHQNFTPLPNWIVTQNSDTLHFSKGIEGLHIHFRSNSYNTVRKSHIQPGPHICGGNVLENSPWIRKPQLWGSPPPPACPLMFLKCLLDPKLSYSNTQDASWKSECLKRLEQGEQEAKVNCFLLSLILFSEVLRLPGGSLCITIRSLSAQKQHVKQQCFQPSKHLNNVNGCTCAL